MVRTAATAYPDRVGIGDKEFYLLRFPQAGRKNAGPCLNGKVLANHCRRDSFGRDQRFAGLFAAREMTRPLFTFASFKSLAQPVSCGGKRLSDGGDR